MTKEEKIKEDFMPIIGYEDIYEVNRLGQVKSISRNTIQKNGKNYLIKERIMKPQIDSTGYIVFGLRENKTTNKVYLHRIISELFIPNPDKKPCVNHKNGVKHDNRIENLEWCTYKENNNHAFETGLQKKGKDHHLYGKKGLECHNHKNYNRGWIKIESEADLPKDENSIEFWIIDDNEIIHAQFMHESKRWYHNENLNLRLFPSHYQLIQKPQPPIY